MDGNLLRIINGFLYKKLNGKLLKIFYPNKELTYQGHLIYQDVLLNDGLDSESLARKAGIWNLDYEQELRTTEKCIKELKQQLYESFFNSQAAEIRSELDCKKVKLNQLYSKKNTLDAYSIKSVAEYARLAFFIENCTFLKNKRYKWKEWTVQSAVYYWLQQAITEDEIRKISLSEEWVSLFNISKNYSTPIFPVASEMNFDQVRLCSWSTIYYNVRQMEDCPREEIFKDNDAFDGYLIKKKNDEDVKGSIKKLNNQISSHVSNHDEIFILPNKDRNLQKVKEIVNSSNSPHANMVKKSRFEAIKNGTVKHGALPDIKQKMIMEANRRKK